MNSCYYNTYLKRFPLQYKTTSGLMAEHPVKLRNCYLILMMDSSGKDGWSNWSPNKISGNCWTLDGKIVKFSWKRLLENYTNRRYWVRITQTSDIEWELHKQAILSENYTNKWYWVRITQTSDIEWELHKQVILSENYTNKWYWVRITQTGHIEWELHKQVILSIILDQMLEKT